MSEVATKKLLENDKVIVWEMVLEPGESTGLHTHEHDYIIQVIDGSTLCATDQSGGNPTDIEFLTDATLWLDVRDGEVALGDLRYSATHDAKNIGNARYREILVEIK